MKTTKNTHPLPSKLSDLILVALGDLEKAEAHPRYKVDMGVWHCPNGHCSICLAGSVMAFGLGAKPTESLYPSDFDTVTEDKLSALNSIRLGTFHDGNLDYYFPVSDYDREPERWKTEMVLTARALREAGL